MTVYPLTWDNTGDRFYETGVDHGVLYVATGSGYGPGVPWNGLINITESPSGAEASPLYADNIKYLNLISAEEFSATVEAYTYPPEFAQCDGTAELGPGVYVGQQGRKSFGLHYRTKLGNDVNSDLGYKLHLVYGCTAKPSEKAYGTVNDSPEAVQFSWELSTTPIAVPNLKPTSIITINSTEVTAAQLSAIETKLYGTGSTAPQLLLPADLVTILGTP